MKLRARVGRAAIVGRIASVGRVRASRFPEIVDPDIHRRWKVDRIVVAGSWLFNRDMRARGGRHTPRV